MFCLVLKKQKKKKKKKKKKALLQNISSSQKQMKFYNNQEKTFLAIFSFSFFSSLHLFIHPFTFIKQKYLSLINKNYILFFRRTKKQQKNYCYRLGIFP